MSAISYRPITASSPSFTQSKLYQKPIKIIPSNSKIRAKRLNLWWEFGCRSRFFSVRSIRNWKRMEGFDGVRASVSDEGVEALEKEAFMVKGSSSLSVKEGGLEATLNNLSKWLVSVVFGAIIIWRHDAEALWAAMGAVLNAVLSVALKKTLNQERPFSTLRSDPGMPSSHAQSIFYTITFLNLSMAERYGINGLTSTLSGLFVILGSYFSWLRVSQQLHTVSQVGVGALLGSVFSVLWYCSWNAFVLNLFVSFLWVRIAVVLGAIGFCLAFIYHIIRSWIVEQR